MCSVSGVGFHLFLVPYAGYAEGDCLLSMLDVFLPVLQLAAVWHVVGKVDVPSLRVPFWSKVTL